ncbi:MAG: hypothetical protein A2Y25_11980 [Candidatus Melainabacteria bacterium GWF2_37_15]|nr:MAG: hypothetical protein A2Y25_11980 [Candidatus Melainabacteria bacterium GWF2_37_15]
MKFFDFFKNQKSKPAKRYYKEAPKTLGQELAKRENLDLNLIMGYLPDPDEILTNSGRDIGTYRELMIDSQVRACVNSRKAGTLSLLWEIDRGKVKSRQAKLIQDLYSDLDIDALNSAILNAPMFGFQPIEIIWEKVGKYILPVDLLPKNQEWFLFDKDGKLRLSTLNNCISGEELPERKFLTPTYNDIHNKNYNPYGDRVLSSCFWPVTFKKSGFKWWVTFTEKYGMPYIIGKLPRHTMDSERESMKDQLEAMVKDAVAVISDDAKLEFIEPGEKSSRSDLYENLINACDHAISKAVLGQTLTTDGNQGGAGSYALGKVHAGVREDIVYSDKKIVERAHNQLIRWIWEINFNYGEIPKFSMFAEEEVNKALAERDEILVKQGIKFSKSYYITNYGLSDRDFEI